MIDKAGTGSNHNEYANDCFCDNCNRSRAEAENPAPAGQPGLREPSTEFEREEAYIHKLQAERDELRKLYENSEQYRQAYQHGKYALYAMGEPFVSAAMEHLPCGEGALDRKFTKLIEMPRIAALQSDLTQAQERVRVLTDALREMREEVQRENLRNWSGKRKRMIERADAAINPNQPEEPNA